MKITKIGHCCLLLEINGTRILTDPGAWTVEQNGLIDVDAVFITHEHADHFHLESLKQILKNNPNAEVYTVSGVGKLLEKEKVSHHIVENSDEAVIKGVLVEGVGSRHAHIYPGIPVVDNTGYLFNKELFYPGDALTVPEQKVRILALPVVGPWVKISEAIDYGIKIRPQMALPVHDGMLKVFTPFHLQPKKFLGDNSIDFRPLLAGESLET